MSIFAKMLKGAIFAGFTLVYNIVYGVCRFFFQFEVFDIIPYSSKSVDNNVNHVK